MIYERMEKLRQVFSRSHIVTHGASLEYAAARVTISHAVAYQSPVVSRQSPVVSRQSSVVSHSQAPSSSSSDR